MVKRCPEHVYKITSESESEECKEPNDGGTSTEGSNSDSVTLVLSDEEPEVESAYEDEEEMGGSESYDLHLNPDIPSKPVSRKRAPANLKESVAKKPKKNDLFQRLWSEEDEIAGKNIDPLADMNAFHQFVRKDIHIDASTTQIQRKIRRLREKFQNNKKKEKGSKDRTFSKPHEQEAYDLSKMIWNSEGKVVGVSVAKGRALLKKKKAIEGSDGKFAHVLEQKTMNFHTESGGTVNEKVMRIGDQLCEAEKASERGKQWRSLKAREIELYITQLEVKKAQLKLVLDIIKS